MVTRRVKLASVAVLAALIASLAAAPAAPAATSPQRKVPFGFMGVLAGAPLAEPGYTHTRAEVTKMAGAGVESVRFAFYWSHAQPDGPFVTRFTRTDRIVAAAARAHIWVLPTVLGAPRWARQVAAHPSSRPRDPEDYARFMGALVDRYGPQGTFWEARRDLPRRPIRIWQV